MMKVEELEVVTEDVTQEDRYSLVQSAQSMGLIGGPSKLTISSLPMKR